MSKKTRSPLKDKPLRLPGQALSEERQRIWDDKVEAPLFVALLMAAVAGLEWWRAWTNAPPQPWLFTFVAVAAVLFAAWRIYSQMGRLRALRLGIDGERAVGQFLERLREQGYQVFHDVPGDNFNLDHVCIGPAGVFTVETKTWSKPVSGNPRVHYDGEQLLVGGRVPDRDALLRAKAQATWLSRLLQESTGRAFVVRPVVVFPGWFVEASVGAQSEVWVMEPKGLPAFLSRQPARLPLEDIKMASYHLSRYVRVHQGST